MFCARHPDRPAVAQCTQCGAFICAQCAEMTGAKETTSGILCTKCYEKKLLQCKEFLNKRYPKRLQKIILSIVFYIIGLLIVISSFATGEIGMFTIFGAILCGFYPALAGWDKGAKEHEEEERQYGARFHISSNGEIYRESGIGKQICYFIFGVIFGVVATPISIIREIRGRVSDKKLLAAIEKELISLSKI